MKVSELIELLRALPPDLEVVRPHYWERDDNLSWPLSLDDVEIVSAKPLDGGGFDPRSDEGSTQIVSIG